MALPPLDCKGCRKCCEGDEIVLGPGDNPAQYKTRPRADGAITLARGSDGNCVYLGPAGCTIHARKPRMCRAYDCRLHALKVSRLPLDQRAARMAMPSVREGFRRLEEAA